MIHQAKREDFKCLEICYKYSWQHVITLHNQSAQEAQKPVSNQTGNTSIFAILVDFAVEP